jgi:hypothetical protein
LPAEAIELPAVNAEQEADVIPAEDGAEDRIEFVEKERVGHGEDADDHGTHAAENGSKNQSFEWGKYAHSLRLGAQQTPDFLALSSVDGEGRRPPHFTAR